MKKSKRSKRSGPTSPREIYLVAAIFCETVLSEKDDVLSAIRIVNRLTRTFKGAVPDASKIKPTPIFFLVMLRSGGFVGEQTVKINHVLPGVSEVSSEVARIDVGFAGDGTGANIILRVNFPFDKEGLHNFDVRIGNRLATRASIEVRHVIQQSVAPADETPAPELPT